MLPKFCVTFIQNSVHLFISLRISVSLPVSKCLLQSQACVVFIMCPIAQINIKGTLCCLFYLKMTASNTLDNTDNKLLKLADLIRIQALLHTRS